MVALSNELATIRGKKAKVAALPELLAQVPEAHSCDVVDAKLIVFGGWNGKKAQRQRGQVVKRGAGRAEAPGPPPVP